MRSKVSTLWRASFFPLFIIICNHFKHILFRVCKYIKLSFTPLHKFKFNYCVYNCYPRSQNAGHLQFYLQLRICIIIVCMCVCKTWYIDEHTSTKIINIDDRKTYNIVIAFIQYWSGYRVKLHYICELWRHRSNLLHLLCIPHVGLPLSAEYVCLSPSVCPSSGFYPVGSWASINPVLGYSFVFCATLKVGHHHRRRANINPALVQASCRYRQHVQASCRYRQHEVLTRAEWILPNTGGAGPTYKRHWVGVNLYLPPVSDLPIPEPPTLPSFPVLLCHFFWLIIREVNVWLAADDINFNNRLNSCHHISPHHN